MHIVTGAAGFIGSNMVKHLNKKGHTNIVCVDTLNQHKVSNLTGLEFSDFISPDELLLKDFEDVTACTLWHLGANSKTSSDDWDSIYHNNVVYTRKLSNKFKNIVFASSASVYGDNIDTQEVTSNLAPKNMYAATKMMCDNSFLNNPYVSKIQSWRFFNVYGNREHHKVHAGMASPYSNFIHQAKTTGVIKLFDNSHEVLRDFICVDDVVEIMYSIYMNKNKSFISNLGTGSTYSFQQWGDLIAKHYNAEIEYIPVPEELQKIYQKYTCSDNNYLMSNLENYKFTTPEEFVEANL